MLSHRRNQSTHLHSQSQQNFDAYKQQLDQWLEEAPYSAVRILEKLQEQGFEGKYSIVKKYVRGKKMDLNEKATVRFDLPLYPAHGFHELCHAF